MGFLASFARGAATHLLQEQERKQNREEEFADYKRREQFAQKLRDQAEQRKPEWAPEQGEDGSWYMVGRSKVDGEELHRRPMSQQEVERAEIAIRTLRATVEETEAKATEAGYKASAAPETIKNKAAIDRAQEEYYTSGAVQNRAAADESRERTRYNKLVTDEAEEARKAGRSIPPKSGRAAARTPTERAKIASVKAGTKQYLDSLNSYRDPNILSPDPGKFVEATQGNLQDGYYGFLYEDGDDQGSFQDKVRSIEELRVSVVNELQLIAESDPQQADDVKAALAKLKSVRQRDQKNPKTGEVLSRGEAEYRMLLKLNEQLGR